MKSLYLSLILSLLGLLSCSHTCAQSSTSSSSAIAAAQEKEPAANTLSIPGRILRTGVELTESRVSPNAMQLAKQLNLTPLFYQLQDLKDKLRSESNTERSWQLRQEILEVKEEICEILQVSQMDVDFVLAEINDEQVIYSDLLQSYTSTRDKTVAVTNAISFGTNGALWAIAEGLDIPTWKRPKYAIPSGTFGILGGIIPSVASALTLKEVSGRHYSAPAAPNMLAKMFDRPTTSDIEYPQGVWSFLNSAPPGDKKTRKEQIIDRWIADKNISNFTDRTSKRQIDIVTASADQHKSLTIAVLQTRQVMLTQLGAEVFKMKRLLLELMMVVRGTKNI